MEKDKKNKRNFVLMSYVFFIFFLFFHYKTPSITFETKGSTILSRFGTKND